MLVAESDPREASETLAEWERVLGLPDHCIRTIPSTEGARRLAIRQALVRSGGQHVSFYVALAEACGYVATVDEAYSSRVPRAGVARVGARVYDTIWAHVWRMDVSPPTGTALTAAELECIIKRAAPAHTVVLFAYL
jgi:uncharacterized protein YmfQ (DUF2313 family)